MQEDKKLKGFIFAEEPKVSLWHRILSQKEKKNIKMFSKQVDLL